MGPYYWKFGSVVWTAVLVAHAAVAQVSPGDFDDLSRRAAAALDVHPDEAVGLYRQALGLRPEWAEGWLYLGATLFQLGRFPESKTALRKGVELAPGKGTAWAQLGLTEYALGDYPQALADMLKGESIGLADQPGFAAAVRYRAALIDLRIPDFSQAIEQLRPLVRSGNDSAPVIEALGISSLGMSGLPENLPENKRPLVDLAGKAAAAFLSEHAEQSLPLFQQLVEKFPSEPGVHYMYGVYLLDRDPAMAEAEFEKELKISPSHVLARVQLVTLLTQRGDANGAVKLAAEAVRLQPGSAVCQVSLGRALLSAGRTDEAIAALEQGKKLAPNAARTHFYLQQAYQKAGREAEARKEKAEFNRLRAEQEPVTIPDPEGAAVTREVR